MFESLYDVLRFLINVARRTGAASEPEVTGALAFIDAHESGTDGELASQLVPQLTPQELDQLEALQRKQEAAQAAAARPLEAPVPAGAGPEPAPHDV